jgi:SAM-dependent methyltransferase
MNLKLTGVDFSANAVGFARAFNPRAEFIVEGLASFRSKKLYDVALCIEVLEHIPPDDLQSVIDAISRCLKPNGRLILSVPSKRIPLSDKHYQHFDIATLTTALGIFFRVDHAYGHVRVCWRRRLLRRVLSGQLIFGPLACRLRFLKVLFRLQKALLRNIEKCGPDEGEKLVVVCQKLPAYDEPHARIKCRSGQLDGLNNM